MSSGSLPGDTTLAERHRYGHFSVWRGSNRSPGLHTEIEGCQRLADLASLLMTWASVPGVRISFPPLCPLKRNRRAPVSLTEGSGFDSPEGDFFPALAQ